MRKLYLAGLLSIGTLALMGQSCMDQGDANVRAVLATACPQWNDVEAIYDAIAAEGVVSQNTANYANIAKRAANDLCTNRETATVISITAAGVRIYKMVDMALADAKRRGVAVGYSGDISKLQSFRDELGSALRRAKAL